MQHNRRGHAQCCVHTHSPVDSLTGSIEFLILAWLTGSVQGTLFGNWLLSLFSCTFPAPLVPRGLESAQLPPTPWVCPNLPFLFFPLRSSSVFSLSLDCLGSRQPGWTHGEGLGSWTKITRNCPFKQQFMRITESLRTLVLSL